MELEQKAKDLLEQHKTEAVNEAKAAAVAEVKSASKATDIEIKKAQDKADAAELKASTIEEKAAGFEIKLNDAEKAFNDYKAAQRLKDKKGGEAEVKSFNQILGDAIDAHANQLKSIKPGNFEMRIPLSEDEKVTEVKAVGDMSIAANFPNSTGFTQQVRNELIETPYNRVWLGDLLPGGTSDSGNSILYPKENGGEGGAALWTDKATDKAQMDFDLTTQSAFFKWIAGYVIADRDMLDDISFLRSYIQNKMLISLKTAENNFILNGSTDANPVQGMLAAATAYSGNANYSAAVDRIIDAGWGQIVEDTEEFYNPTHVILTPRDSVKIGLNKATGSGEYDLPQGSVSFSNGQLQIGGITGVRTTQIGTNNFLTFDARATMFVRRLLPELRVFEDAALAKRNKIMFRIEERATYMTFNNKALVKGVLTGTGA